jgi:hypothetical protein
MSSHTMTAACANTIAGNTMFTTNVSGVWPYSKEFNEHKNTMRPWVNAMHDMLFEQLLQIAFGNVAATI